MRASPKGSNSDEPQHAIFGAENPPGYGSEATCLAFDLSRTNGGKRHGSDDTVFADMRVAGPNPLVIVKMTGPIAKFPITNQQFQSVMGNNDDLDTAIAQGRVYIADYAALD